MIMITLGLELAMDRVRLGIKFNKLKDIQITISYSYSCSQLLSMDNNLILQHPKNESLFVPPVHISPATIVVKPTPRQ